MKVIPNTKPHRFREVFLVFLVSFCSYVAWAQNTSKTSYSANGIDTIVIDATQIFTINVKAVQTKMITITSVTNGEYQNNFKVVSKEDNGTLTVALQRSGMDDIPDDKRNAHKIVVAEVQVELPEDKSISIKSDIGSVTMNGKFKDMLVDLEQGSFTANATAEDARIKTIDGNIFLETKNALIETDSHHGLVDTPKDLFGFGVWKLQTNGGNITVKKVE